MLVLPKEREGLARVESQMAQMDMKQLEQGLYIDKVLVKIPKFKLEESLDLVGTLQQVSSISLSLSIWI